MEIIKCPLNFDLPNKELIFCTFSFCHLKKPKNGLKCTFFIKKI